jgi:hypothetical protein
MAHLAKVGIDCTNLKVGRVQEFDWATVNKSMLQNRRQGSDGARLPNNPPVPYSILT